MTLLIYRHEIYRLKETPKSVLLIYEFTYPGAGYTKVLGRVSGWRKNMFLKALPLFKANKEELEYVPGLRMYLYISLLPTIDRQFKAEMLAEILAKMPFEELVFWSWKFTSMKKDAVRGFRAMYLNG
ncbi:MAG: hypothetical protein ACP5GS_07995 [Nitrososphaeria archaeon]